jgi:hypothetical protein
MVPQERQVVLDLDVRVTASLFIEQCEPQLDGSRRHLPGSPSAVRPLPHMNREGASMNKEGESMNKEGESMNKEDPS